MTRLLTTEDIKSHFEIEDCLTALESMFKEWGNDHAVTDSREDLMIPVEDPPEDATPPVYYQLKSMGGAIVDSGVGAIRINSDLLHWPGKHGNRNQEKIPAADGRYTGLVLLFSAQTGEPLLIFPDGFVQSYRVAGTSTLGAKYLARKDTVTLGLLGSGQQAWSHLLALNSIHDLETVNVYSPTRKHRTEFAARMNDKVNPTVYAVDEPEIVFKDADVIQCATNTSSPIFDPDWIEPGTHIGIINASEAPKTFYQGEIVDIFVQAWSPVTQIEKLNKGITERKIPTKNTNTYIMEDSECIPKFAESDTTDEPVFNWGDVPSLSSVIVDDSLGRSNLEEVTAFRSLGTGLQFAAVGHILYKIAEKRNLGYNIPTEQLTQEYRP